MFRHNNENNKTDILQRITILTYFLEDFRNVSLKYYEIDPCQCYSAPGLSCNAGLKYSGVQLKYHKKDTYDMLLFFEKGIRGGIA